MQNAQMRGFERLWNPSFASVFAAGCRHGWGRAPSA
jgi:hypothetical protein